MKAILAVDGSPNAEDAVREFALLGCSEETTVRVLTVVENIAPRSRFNTHSVTTALEQARREESREAEEYVARVASELNSSGRTTEGVVRHGDPRVVIVRS